MAHGSTTASQEHRFALEVLDRVDAARTICDAALLGGQWFDPAVLEGVGDLMHAAARWAQVTEVAS